MDLIVIQNEAHWGEHVFPCSIGKTGIVHEKVEGDNGTPVGRFPFRKLYYRADRLAEPPTCLPTLALAEDDGWCDAPEDRNYNMYVKLPYDASHEVLWREDDLYNIVLVVGHNDDPPVPGKGSAIFVHLHRDDGGPTAGCVALGLEHLLQILNECDEETCLVVKG